jgi:hypothetical protein
MSYNSAFKWHFRRFAEHAGRQAIIDASETQTDPHELIRFAKYRFDDLLNLFTASFCDSSDGIPSFLPTALRAVRMRQ